MRALKKQLKQTFAQVADDKQTFDMAKDNLQKHRITTSSEKLIASADEALRKYQFQLQMLRVNSESKSKFESDLDSL